MTLFRLIRRRKRIITGALTLFTLLVISLAIMRIYTAGRAKNQIYAVNDVPERPVAIIFGALVYPSGRPSPMLADRVKIGAQLYEAGKVKALLLTGDNHI